MVVGVDPSPVEGCFVGPVVIRYIARSDLLLSCGEMYMAFGVGVLRAAKRRGRQCGGGKKDRLE